MSTVATATSAVTTDLDTAKRLYALGYHTSELTRLRVQHHVWSAECRKLQAAGMNSETQLSMWGQDQALLLLKWRKL